MRWRSTISSRSSVSNRSIVAAERGAIAADRRACSMSARLIMPEEYEHTFDKRKRQRQNARATRNAGTRQERASRPQVAVFGSLCRRTSWGPLPNAGGAVEMLQQVVRASSTAL